MEEENEKKVGGGCGTDSVFEGEQKEEEEMERIVLSTRALHLLPLVLSDAKS